jgi:uncharacterized membrane protein
MAKKQKTSANISVQQSYSGPIPDPHSLAQYEQVQPGLAERIIRMAEQEVEHRHRQEDMLIKNTIKMATVGIIFSFVSVILFCGLILCAIIRGMDMATLGIAIGAIASVAGVFIAFKSKNKF